MTTYYPTTNFYNMEYSSYYAVTPDWLPMRAQFGNYYSGPSPRCTSYGQYATTQIVKDLETIDLCAGPPFSPRYTSSGKYATPTTWRPQRRFRATSLGAEGRPRPDIHLSRRNSASTKKDQSATKECDSQPRLARTATEADAKRHKIPIGYSLKNWDPTEEPITLLGSVFDASSLGRWIYDWTIYHHGAGSPIAGLAGEFWLLLIQLAGKIKCAEEAVPEIRSEEKQKMIGKLIEAGDRLTDKLQKLLKVCEAPMLRSGATQKDGQLGKSAAVEFVATLFGRDRELERTERLMASIRLWNLRFDTNCEDIIRVPTT
ncbi:hypothetical protein C7999DRAFT_36276 [Corynascus novoguineensis]|uniref:Vegetative cell wall protein gp1 n=1 Tax=Corynascus novoguineensis TaxID=1126955 RepID=A0AAN7CJW2_9PEZI|nr:hypothetical protein C7999DRAFT_36276 [Corynascus novoguineensis]